MAKNEKHSYLEEDWVGTAGNDTLYADSAADDVIIEGGDGRDRISIAYRKYQWANRLTIDGGEGDDTITAGWVDGTNDNNLQDGVTVFGGSGNDVIKVISSNASIEGGAGNDTLIDDHGLSNVYFDGGDGNDFIDMDNENATVLGGVGNDTISVKGSNVTVDGGEGNDVIKIFGMGDEFSTEAVVAGGAGKDTFVLLQPALGATLTDVSAEDILIIGVSSEMAGYQKDDFGNANPFYKTDGRLTSLSAEYSKETKKLTLTGQKKGWNTLRLTLENIENIDDLLKMKVYNGSLNGKINTKNMTTLGDLIAAGQVSDGMTVSNGKLVISNAFQGVFALSDYDQGGYSYQPKDVTAAKNKNKLTISGDARDNTLTAGSAGNTLYGLAGDDKLVGGAGSDSLAGDEDNDSLYGGAGNDSLDGGTGSDLLQGGAGNDTLTGGAGSDTFVYTNGDGKDVVTDYADGDMLQISKGNIAKTIVNENNDVVFTVGKGTVTLENAGSQEIVVKDSRGSYTLSETGITLGADFSGKMNFTPYLAAAVEMDGRSAENNLNLSGNADANTIRGGAGADKLYGGAGNDNLQGNSGNDYLSGDAGDDSLYGGDGVDSLYGGVGDDYLDGGESNDKLYGGAGNDELQGSVGDDYLSGDAGNDSLDGGEGNDKLHGGVGADTLEGGLGDDYLYGEAGNDLLDGGVGDDQLAGGAGSDTFVYRLGDGNDVVTDYTAGDWIEILDGTITGLEYANKNKDVLIHVGEGNILLKGAANRVITLRDTYGSYTVTKTSLVLNNGTGDYYDLLPTWKQIDLSATAADVNVTVKGNDLANTIIGGVGNDSLTGGMGNDTFVFYSGGGNDVVTDYAEGDWLQIREGRITNIGETENGDLYFEIDGENGAGRITLTGAAKNPDRTVSVKGTDGISLYGNSQANTIQGSAGRESLVGGAGDDTISGNAGNDWIDGGTGDDSLIGGTGNDTFVFRDGNGADVVADFGKGKDALYLASELYAAEIVDKDLVFRGADGSITLTGAASKTVALKNEDGAYTMNKTTLTAAKGFGGTLDAAKHLSTIKTMNASATANAVTLRGNSLDNVITGGAGSDSLFGVGGHDKLIGNKGDDYLNGGAGDDTLTGGVGNDTFVYRPGDGDDVITDYAAGDWLHIVDGEITGVEFANKNKDILIHIGEGSVLVKGAAGQAISVKDLLGEYTITKGLMPIRGTAGADSLTGTTGNDALVGGAGDDTLSGGAGSDTFIYHLGGGNDVITDYGEGDWLQIQSGEITGTRVEGDDVYVDVGPSSAGEPSGSVMLKDAANRIISVKDKNRSYTVRGNVIIGTSGNDILTGGAGDDSLDGGAGNDTLIGGAGKDTLVGGGGNDLLDGGAGSDILTGGAGNDTFRYHYDRGNDIITDYEQGKDKLLIEGGTSVPVMIGPIYSTELTDDGVAFQCSTCSVTVQNGKGKTIALEDNRGGYTMSPTALTLGEDFNGTMNAKRYLDTVKTVDGRKAKKDIALYGNEQDNVMYGGTGNDFVYGDTGNDTISGGTGNDSLAGGSGKDSLNGGAGSDWLYGGKGSDTLTGGAGKDTFVYWQGTGNDVITDYEQGQDILFTTAQKCYVARDDMLFLDYDAYLAAYESGSVSVEVDGSYSKRAKELGIHVSTVLQSGGQITKATLANGGKDIVLSMGSDSSTVTLKNAASKTISLRMLTMGNNGYSYGGNYTMNKTELKAAADFTGTLNAKNYLSTITTVDGSAATNTVNLYGNANANVVKAGKAGGTIGGGAGNDTLYGGAGSDVFKYVSGNDIFFNYEEGKDKIWLAEEAAIVSAADSGRDKVLKTTDGTVTIKGAAGKTIAFFDANEQPNNPGEETQTGKTFEGTVGDDLLTGSEGNDLLDGGAGNDILTGGAGNDTFRYHYDEGNDIITDYEQGKDKLLIEGGASEASLLGPFISTELDGDDVSFQCSACTVTVKNGKGKTIALQDNRGGYTMTTTALTLDAGYAGAMNAKGYLDTITTVDGRKAAQPVVLYGNEQNNVIDGGTGDDFLYGDVGNDTISGGVGDDSLAGGADDDSLNGGDGNDWLYGGAGNDTMTGGAGNDTFTYWAGTGNDVVTDYEQGQDILFTTAQKYYLSPENLRNLDSDAFFEAIRSGVEEVEMDQSFCKRARALGVDFRVAAEQGGQITKAVLANSGKDIVFTVGDDEGTVTLQNAADKTISLKTYVSTNNGDTYVNYTMNKTELKAGADFTGTLNAANYLGTIATVDGSAATMTVNLYGNDNANTIIGGNGNDKLFGCAGNDSLTGGDGDDTLNGGVGTNYLTGDAGSDYFYCGIEGANDTILDYTTGEDVIAFDAGVTLTSSEKSGDDVVLTLSNGSKVTVRSAVGKEITYKLGDNVHTLTVEEGGTNTSPQTAITQQDVITRLMKSLDETTGVLNASQMLDTAVNYASYGLFTTYSVLVNSFADAVRDYGSAEQEGIYYQLDGQGGRTLVIGEATDNFLKTYCGIDLTNEDTGAITGLDAGGTEKTAESIVPETGTISNVLHQSEASTTINGLTFLWPEREVDANSIKNAIVDRIYTWWAESGLSLVENSYGISFTEEGTTVNQITVQFENQDSDALATVTNSFITSGYDTAKVGTTTELTLTVNMKFFENIDLSDINGNATKEVNGKTQSVGYLDRVLAHEFTHAVMAANINCFSYLPTAVKEGLAELVHGIDDRRMTSINCLTWQVNADALRTNLNTSAVDESMYSGGYMLFRYFAKYVAENANIGSSGSPMMVSSPVPILAPDSTTNASVGSSGSNATAASNTSYTLPDASPQTYSMSDLASDSASTMWFESGSMASTSVGDTQLSALQDMGLLETTFPAVAGGTRLGLTTLAAGSGVVTNQGLSTSSIDTGGVTYTGTPNKGKTLA